MFQDEYKFLIPTFIDNETLIATNLLSDESVIYDIDNKSIIKIFDSALNPLANGYFYSVKRTNSGYDFTIFDRDFNISSTFVSETVGVPSISGEKIVHLHARPLSFTDVSTQTTHEFTHFTAENTLVSAVNFNGVWLAYRFETGIGAYNVYTDQRLSVMLSEDFSGLPIFFK